MISSKNKCVVSFSPKTVYLALIFCAPGMFGTKVYADVEIAADGNRTLNEVHDVAEHVHDGLEEHFPDLKHVMVHVNPYQKET